MEKLFSFYFLGFFILLINPGCNKNTIDQSRPNVVLFYLDDSGYGDFEHNGNPTIKTPNITSLKQAGISFTQFYVTSPACSASRYSLLTGRYPGRSGLNQWVIGPSARKYINENEFTLAEGLKSVGYTTGIFGKWHLGTPNENNEFSTKAFPLAHGFDEWLGTDVSHDYWNSMLIRSDPAGDIPVAGYTVLADSLPSDPAACDTLTKLCTDAAIAFIKRNEESPFFAYIPFNMPHLGLFAHDDFKNTSRRGVLGDVMEELDYSIGRVIRTLEESGLSDNTIIIFSSDNGPWFVFRDRTETRHGDTRLQVGYATPFRDGKGSTWEGGHRVPGIISWPAGISGNRTVQTPVSTLDILPTIFAITGVQIPADRSIDGRDIRSILMPDKYEQAVDTFEFFYHYSDNKPSAVRKGPWKLHIRIASQTGNNYGFEASRTSPLLFQLEQDLGERIDRSGEQPQLVERMLAELSVFDSQVREEGSFWDSR